MNTNISVALSDAEIAACYPVMRVLRPHISEEQFLSQFRTPDSTGYRLAFLQAAEGIVSVAGFHLSENLAWGRFLYVDDLVTLPDYRSKGYGSELLTWLKKYAIEAGCLQLHLDSGIQRKEAHRFYEREGMTLASFHFIENIGSNK